MISKFCKLVWILPLLLIPGMGQAISVGFDPASQAVVPGDTIMTDVVISDLGSGAAPSLGTYDLDIAFDESHLSFVSTSFGNQLDLFGLGSVNSSALIGNGILNLFELSLDLPADLDTLQADSFALATLTFDVLSADSSALAIGVNALGDSFGDPLTADVIGGGNITSTDAPVSVSEPSVLLLFFLGLAVLWMTVRQNSKTGLSFNQH